MRENDSKKNDITGDNRGNERTVETMPIIKPRTLSGFLELLPEQQVKFERMLQTLRGTFAAFGFTPMDTPIIEAADILLAKGGGETEKQIYRLQKGDADLALRFDLTVPLAKYAAQHCAELCFPFRRYQIGKVYRGERAQRGRFREFYQADIDIVGDGGLSIADEAEIPAVIYHAFTALGLRRFQIRLNNRKLLAGFFELLGLGERAAGAMRSIDKRDKLGTEKVRELLLADGVSSQAADAILSLAPDTLERYAGKNALFDAGLSELRAVMRLLPEFGVPETHFVLDLSVARGLDYYTGTVYETVMTAFPEVGSICSGGRYDDLAGYYIDRKLPGVGMSIGLTRLFSILQEQGLLSDEGVSAPCDALILPMGADSLPAAGRVAALLRGRGVRTALHCEDKKFKAKLAYADKLKIPFVVILGEDELRDGVVSLKNMETSRQSALPAQAAAEQILSELARRNSGTVIKERDI